MNKGILCAACNESFSELDSLLSAQLNIVNGMIGVRPDRWDEAKPARMDSPYGPIDVDAAGKPMLAAPRVVDEQLMPDGRTQLLMRFGDEEQIQTWLSEQRARGVTVEKGERGQASSFFPNPIRLEWSFGGEKSLRELGRIALNFLAHRWPDMARAEELGALKEFVLGKKSPAPGEPVPVWYASESAFPMPESPFSFGHQILIVLAPPRVAYARIRLFSTFDLFVFLGSVPVSEASATLFDIDPLAEHPPDDVRTSSISPQDVPLTIVPPGSWANGDPGAFLSGRVRLLLSRIEDRQWMVGTKGLLEAINETCSTPRRQRARDIGDLLRPHRGRVLGLARFVANEVRTRASDKLTSAMADACDAMISPDESGTDGLSVVAQAYLELASTSLAQAICDELDKGPITDEQLRLFLAGGPGAHAVGRVMLQMIRTAFAGVAEDTGD